MKKGTCEICSDEEAKYKCSSCRIRYCSVSCFKSHKNEHCLKVSVSSHDDQMHSQRIYRFPTEDTVPLERLSLLGKSETLTETLQNRLLRDMLIHVNASSDPSVAIQTAMQVPEFIKFVDECLHVVEP